MIGDETSARDWVRNLPECDDAALQKLEILKESLIEENSRQNLVARQTLAQIWQRHIADSAQLLRHVPRGTGMRWLDLGTGAGFPGLVIAALRPETSVTMVESRNRRIMWLKDMCNALELDNASVAGARLELISEAHCDVISARAFAPLPQLLSLASRFSTPATLWVLPKGRSAAQEVAELKGWHHMFHVEHSLTDPDAGIVVGTLLGQKG
ncbi:16S rRNA (guanine(527)-N(7))-methyltransferase RsmG [Novosphingobium sp. M1R2S20]|uniref:Ribosomal RNA small subunit methyltransferase G n=1 Tax=Novosphingobium rhizovicinum TaxID=3228928 RepID=A0ABV3R9G4_9SPHN